jgi:hypothetical protein
MSDGLQSKPTVKPMKARVEVVRPGQKTEVVSGETINAVAAAFLKQLRRLRRGENAK